MTNRTIQTIGDVTILLKRGAAPKYTKGNGTIVINQKCIRDWFINFSVSRLTDPNKKKISPERLLRKFDVLVNSTGVGTLGRVAQFFEFESDVTVDSHVTIVRPDLIQVDPLCFGYAMKNVQSAIEALAAGSTGQTELSREALGHLEIEMPLWDFQAATGRFLKRIDDKIELNRQMNETLEAMAQAIFKNWFVDFGPVKRKASGTTNPVKILGGLISDPDKAEPIANLFPDSFGDEGLPEGWERKLIGDVCSRIFSGGTPRTKELSYWEGEIPWLSSGETRSSFIIGTEKTITELGVDNSSTREAKAGTTVIASAGQGKTRGQTSYLAFDSFINQSVVALQANENMISKSFLYLDLKRRYAEFRAVSDAHSSRGSLTTKLLAGLDVVCPKREIIEKFDLIVIPMIEKIVSNLRENKTLAETRDYLLPRLMSGEVRVTDLEEVA